MHNHVKKNPSDLNTDPLKQTSNSCVFMQLIFFSPIKNGTSKSHTEVVNK